MCFTETNLRDDETADPFWVKKAGLQAAALAEALGDMGTGGEHLWPAGRKAAAVERVAGK